MDIRQRVICVFGFHKRSRGSATDDGRVLRSRCRGCGVAMVKTLGGWQVDPEARATNR